MSSFTFKINKKAFSDTKGEKLDQSGSLHEKKKFKVFHNTIKWAQFLKPHVQESYILLEGLAVSTEIF